METKGMKEPVRLRRRETKSGVVSLYLDTYHRGRREYEFLRLYLYPGNDRETRRKNRETLALAEAIRAKRTVELRNGAYGFRGSGAGDGRFYDYFTAECGRRAAEGKGDGWKSCLRHLERYAPGLRGLRWRDIDRGFVEGFRGYLLDKAGAQGGGRLARNSAAAYFALFRSCLAKAHRDGAADGDPARTVGGIKTEETERTYLTVEEVRAAARAECGNARVKDAFLFSCLTGLRISDIRRLSWADVHEQDGFTRIIFRQKKTRGQEYLDVNAEARKLMGTRGGDAEAVFGGLPGKTAVGRDVARWMLRAGIRKKVTFHCARHTFATMMLALGTDLYTVSKLLGHREIGTTQIYARVVDKGKREAVSRIPRVLPDADG